MKINPMDPRSVKMIMPPTEVRQKEIESIMWDGIYVKLMSAEEWPLTPSETSWFGWRHGIYQFPTKELIDHIDIYLMARGVQKDDDECIEIGAGGGHIGHHLGIRMTDNKLQEDPTIASYYQSVHQPILKYSPEVEKIDANAAVLKYQPRVVIGCWVTEFPQLMFGVREPEMMKEIESYLFIGNKVSHRLKPILAGSDGNYFPWIISRSINPQENRIWTIKGGK